jgi:hypothetical protein
MDVATILTRAGIPPVTIRSLLGLGLGTPEATYVFLLNHPSVVRPDVTAALGLDWSGVDPAKLRDAIILALAGSAALGPDFREAERRQDLRSVTRPLGAAALTQAQAPHVSAAQEMVAAVELDAAQREIQGARGLPAEYLNVAAGWRWPVRDQANWPACVAFALAACFEALRARTLPLPVMPVRESPRFLYRKSRRAAIDAGKVADPAYRTGGLKFEDVDVVAASAGSCLESLCQDGSFEPADRSNTLASWSAAANPISAKADTNAGNRRAQLKRLDFPIAVKRPAGLARMVFDWLKQGNAVALALAGFADPARPKASIWYSEIFWQYGVLPLPAPHAVVGSSGHAICITGYLPALADPAAVPPVPNFYKPGLFAGFFVFRNSWGTEFPKNTTGLRAAVGDAAFPAGYGLIPAAAVEYFGWEYAVAQPVP